ncbi:MAG TPA: hypothetical protein VL633_09380 [Bacteroidota bacterium]|nr:hypothetical protein [Bacteroidota bacterium]
METRLTKSNGKQACQAQRCTHQDHNHLLHLRADLRMVIHVMEEEKGSQAPGWQIASLKESLGDVEGRISELRNRALRRRKAALHATQHNMGPKC